MKKIIYTIFCIAASPLLAGAPLSVLSVDDIIKISYTNCWEQEHRVILNIYDILYIESTSDKVTGKYSEEFKPDDTGLNYDVDIYLRQIQGKDSSVSRPTKIEIDNITKVDRDELLEKLMDLLPKNRSRTSQ